MKISFADPTVEVEIDGQTFTLSAWGYLDFEAARAQVTSMRIRAFREASVSTDPDSNPDSDPTERVRVLADLASRFVTDGELDYWTQETPEGVAFMIHRSLVKSHPDLTRSDVWRLCHKDGALTTIVQTMSKLGQPEDSKAVRPTPETPTTGKTESPT